MAPAVPRPRELSDRNTILNEALENIRDPSSWKSFAPPDLASQLHLAQLFFDKKRFDIARDLTNEIAAAAPNDPAPLQLRARIALYDHDDEAATGFARRGGAT